MSALPKHTPTPWKLDEMTVCAVENDYSLATVRGPAPGLRGKEWAEDMEVCKANAAFIVRACNSHAKLVEALEEVEVFFDVSESDPAFLAKIRAALKLAKGEA